LVFAFGSPLGLESSVTQGIVSAKARQLRREDPMIYVQTDAPINPGNSGGPLVDTEGRVVGINTLILSQSGGSEGLGFAAPSNIVKTIFEQIRDSGRVRRGVIGVYAQTLTPALSQGLGIPIESKVILGDVMPNGPGAQAGLNPGDIILTLDGKAMENARQFDVNVYGKQIGKKVTLEVRRGSRDLSIDCEVVERPGDLFRFKELANPEDSHVEELDILALEVDQRIRSMLPNLRYDAGVLVAVSSGRASVWGDGLIPGDVIYNVNDKRVTTVNELRKAVGKMKSSEIFVVHLERHGQLMYAALEIE